MYVYYALLIVAMYVYDALLIVAMYVYNALCVHLLVEALAQVKMNVSQDLVLRLHVVCWNKRGTIV